MGKRNHCFPVICVRKIKGKYILRISHIPTRSLFFFDVIRKANGKVCKEGGGSVISGCRFFNKRPLFHNHNPICIYNIIGCIQTKNTAIQRILCILIFLCHSDLCFLAVIGKGCLRKDHIHVLPRIGQGNFFFFSAIIKIFRSLHFSYKISS